MSAPTVSRTATSLLALAAMLSSLPGSPVSAEPPADMLLLGGKIVTMDDAIGTVQAIAIAGDRIAAAGSDAELSTRRGPSTVVIELDGRLAVPGFIEGHGHFVGLGQSLMQLDLSQARNWNEIVELVATETARRDPGEWIVGRGWHQEKWDESPPNSVEGFPVHDALSAASPSNPVLLIHASGHASAANEFAMNLAGISGSTPDPAGGEILRDDRGQPIGIFRERASALVGAARARQSSEPTAQRALLDRAIDLAVDECLAKGVTSFQDAGTDFATIGVIAARAREGRLGLRLWMMVREPNDTLTAELDQHRFHRVGKSLFTVGGIKRTLDGALGSRGAWLRRPYDDRPTSTGLATAGLEDVAETARIAADNRLQLCVHAIGDQANHELLDLYERVFDERGDGPARRWRIEHAQHLDPADVPRFGALGVIASMQGIHCTSDAPWVYARLGEARAREGAYVWQSLMRGGAIVTNGTDAPVEDVDPIPCFYATVTRRLADGTVFFPEQRMSRMEALRSYTVNNAFAAFEEDIKGTLTPGKLADITVLSRDILTIPDDAIRGTRVDYTIVGGRVAYEGDR